MKYSVTELGSLAATNVPAEILIIRHSTAGDLFYKYQTKDLELYSCRVLTAAGYPTSTLTAAVKYPNSCRVP